MSDDELAEDRPLRPALSVGVGGTIGAQSRGNLSAGERTSDAVNA